MITELGKGEALVSLLEDNGVPSMVERTMIRPPSSRVGPVTPEERAAVIAKSPLKGVYDTAIDADSAYERLQNRVHETAAPPPPGQVPGVPGPWGRAPGQPPGAPPQGQGEQPEGGGLLGQIGGVLGGLFGTGRPRSQRLSTGQLVTREVTRSVVNKVAGKVAADVGKSLGGSLGGSIGRAIVRGTLGGILRR